MQAGVRLLRVEVEVKYTRLPMPSLMLALVQKIAAAEGNLCMYMYSVHVWVYMYVCMVCA